ncbi:type VI secretion system ATPase TssH [Vibrio sp. SS-MA-C1-2]|uniref:type VI secretion system ATPase TssH n=1 Tax=Vibrio sp. SS-MA-C1-2 TaxID=2908646 RepID=UPI001F3346AB|nr:type VI secretion system ATPase TssH [Vibrio sp. SS-MA-C1-2]UJF17206.1 type VI secretion system ATPase TssH [Vibrio sp. SS-MA-C1-2]
MSQIKLGNLVGKLSVPLKNGLEEAAGVAMNQGVATIEIEHWIAQLISTKDEDILAFCTQQKINSQQFFQELQGRIERLPKGAAGQQPTISKALSESIENAWLQASVNYGQGQITSLHLLLVLLQEDNFGVKKLVLETLQNVSIEALSGQISQLKVAAVSHESGSGSGATQAPTTGGGALDKYTTNLTQQARDGGIDPISGRNSEVRQAIDILCRKRQNNPIFVGEAGVGKTAVVEGLALRIAAGEVPTAIQGVEIHSLDLGLLQAGASIKGEFENRLKDVINEVKSAEKPIIVFIDEAHTLIGAGGAAGQNDAANLLKPALARGEFRSIAATTWAEYKKYFEKDPALTRRFQVIKIEEPNEEDALQILREVGKSLSQHHGVFITKEALEAAISLSVRYLPARQLPDKAISLLDTSCARVALTQGSKPERIEGLEQKIRYLESELSAIETEEEILVSNVSDHQELISTIEKHKAELQQQNERWLQEKDLVTEIKAAIAVLTEEETNSDDRQQSQNLITEKLELLQSLQGEYPMVFPIVDEEVIATVIESWTGIPAGKMVKDEIAQLLSLEDTLHRRVIGQNRAISEIAKSIRISRAGLTDSRKPVGVFLMCGPSGVGKTETAMALADDVFGGENNLTVINMTEFKEEHKISMLLGSPAGYVGFGEGGVLTEAIRRNPYCVLLLDEMEKAHTGVHDLFYQIFDKGHIKDSEGRTVDFKNTIIIMTSNAADQAICDICSQEDELISNEVLLEEIRPALQESFKPAFLGRSTIIPYYPLSQDDLAKIAVISLNRVAKKLMDQYQATFKWQDDFIEFISSRNSDMTIGGRAVEQIINQTLMPQLANECIERLSHGEPITDVSVSIDKVSGKLLLTVN